jgi:hypothetical protein
MSLHDAFTTFETATQTALRNPREALPLARDALHGFRWSCRCMRVRTGCLVGLILSDLGRLGRSERIFSILYELADGCACCQPVLDRHSSVLLSVQKRHSEAIERATLALEAVLEDRPLYVLTLGKTYQDAKDRKAIPCYVEALEAYAPGSPLHRMALMNLSMTLAGSEEDEDAEEVARLLPVILKDYKDERGLSVERAFVKWLQGTIYTSKARNAKPRARRTLLCDARDELKISFARFVKLGLAFQSAVWSDMVAIQAQLDRFRIPKLIEDTGRPKNFDVMLVVTLAKSTQGSAAHELIRTLRTFRDACECGPCPTFYS